ncbi:uncharacterized protein F4812DRAFT_453951 [Daldinia caldariorum]|uniref:uncharacterized protein n=1 Tax=Daldinia caldariorum TaxID=326644 RepID=UPI0020072134|nr:uncharacterized protein F4812DRAFT_453951 [Daldinia caldariorum]KAI1472135.1 hypothetical protein F4812DRAFT_453951 [Daldinia caldariorum]
MVNGVTPAQILCGTQGTDTGQCRNRHIELPGSKLPTLPRGLPDIRGLSELQAGREEWLVGDAIDRSLKVYRDALPKMAREMIHIVDTSLGDWFDESDVVFNRAMGKNYRRFYRSFKTTEYTLWPMNVHGNHWELGVIRKEKATTGDYPWTRIVQFAIIDSWEGTTRGPQRLFVEARAQKFFKQNGFTFATDYRRDIGTGNQPDIWSCGLRTFWAAKIMMNRIASLVKGDVYRYTDKLWIDLRGWFNPDFTRWEMIGLNAYSAIQEMGYKGRIAVEVVDQVREGTGNVDAAKTMTPPSGGDSVVVNLDDGRKHPRDDTDDVEEQPPTRRGVDDDPPVPNQQAIAPSYSIAQGSYQAYDLGRANPVFPPPSQLLSHRPAPPTTSSTGSRIPIPVPAPAPAPQPARLFTPDASDQFNRRRRGGGGGGGGGRGRRRGR